jgi:acid stress-induced BolA-like protein IbaG/YrbA
MNFQYIKKLYPQVVTTIDQVAYDVDGNEVAYDKPAVQALVDSQAYIAKRQAEYPPITDYIDGVVKSDQAQIDAYIAACLAVKAKYPKSE